MALSKLASGLYVYRGKQEETPLATTREGGLKVAQALPAGAEATRQGKRWSVINTSALASLVVRPSTVAMVTLYNAEPGGGKSYVIERLFAHALVTAANSTYGIWAQINERDASPIGADDMAAEIRSHNGGHKYGGNAVVGIAETVVAEGWFPHGRAGVSVTVTVPGAQLEAKIDGRMIIPPLNALSITVVSNNTSNTFTSGMEWTEEQLDIE